jgi:hypothetical protein
MDQIKILKRAWSILWSYRALWVFGLIIAIATAGGGSGGGGNAGSGGGGGSDSGTSAQFPDGPFNFDFGSGEPESVPEFFQMVGEAFQEVVASEPIVGEIVTIVIVLVCLVIFLGLLWAVARYVAEVALIKMVDSYETDGVKLGVKQGFRLGWSRKAWRFFLINLIVSLPAILFVLFLVAVVAGAVALIALGNPSFSIPLIVVLVGILFVSIFSVIIISALLKLLRHFFWRACALEDVGVIEALRQGFGMVRSNLKDVGIMWLIMIGLEIAWAVLMIPAFLLLLPLLAATGLVGLLLGGAPAAAIGGITSLFLTSPINWILGGLIGVIIFFIVMFLPFTLLSGLKETYLSTIWTLVYREINLVAGLLPGELAEITNDEV